MWTDLFLLVERWIDGDVLQRRKLDAAPWGAAKIARRVAKHAAWLAIAFATGGVWIAYYVDAPTLARGFFTGDASVAALCLRVPVHRHDLSAGGLGARTSLHLYVPVAALSGGHVRRPDAERVVPRLARRAARQAA